MEADRKRTTPNPQLLDFTGVLDLALLYYTGTVLTWKNMEFHGTTWRWWAALVQKRLE